MRRFRSNQIRKIKVAVVSMAAVGMMYSSACTVGDFWHNVVNGTLSFVKGYTTDVWETVVPAPGDFMSE